MLSCECGDYHLKHDQHTDLIRGQGDVEDVNDDGNVNGDDDDNDADQNTGFSGNETK